MQNAHLCTKPVRDLANFFLTGSSFRKFGASIRFPAAAARVWQAFEWKGHQLPGGRRALLDLYGTNHDARTWDAPEAFRPERLHRWNGSPFNFISQGGGDHCEPSLPGRVDCDRAHEAGDSCVDQAHQIKSRSRIWGSSIRDCPLFLGAVSS